VNVDLMRPYLFGLVLGAVLPWALLLGGAMLAILSDAKWAAAVSAYSILAGLLTMVVLALLHRRGQRHS